MRAGSGHAAQDMPTIGILLSQPGHPLVAGMLAELRALGYETDRNLRVVIRSADMQLEQLPQLATELVEHQPDVIVSFDTPPTRAAVDATKSIPIVLWAGDPIGSGFVTNISRPGGNVTGISNFAGELSAKRLQIAKEMVTTAKRFGGL